MDALLNSSTLVFLFLAVYLLDSVSRVLNIQTSLLPLPPSLADLQTPAEQQKASDYLRERVFFGLVKDTFFLIAFFLFLQSGLFGWLQLMSQHRFASQLGQALFYVAMLALGQGLLSIPFSVYSTFKIEAKYGFNRTTAGIFVGDLLKGGLLGAILGGLLFSFIVKMLEVFGDHAWLNIWLGYTAFQFFLVWLAPVTLLPLFLKLSPLPEGPLKTAIESYSKKQSFKLDGAWVCDASKRSAKSNAFFTGFGRFRRLVLFDTLIEKHPEAEIVAIVAHEAGHFKLGHIWKLSLFSAFSSLVFFYLIQHLVAEVALYHAFHTFPGNLGIGLVLAFMVLNKILYFLSPLGAYFSRRNEFAADEFSAQTTGDPASLVSGLKRLVTTNLATLQHHPLYVVLHDSHPPLPDRIKPLEAAKARQT
ncbi:MAG: M48 family metallopeptidase [Bdellovibrionales bacterium]|nr:M48 family metallopeptidase [Oligoflexia bacterium]